MAVIQLCAPSRVVPFLTSLVILQEKPKLREKYGLSEDMVKLDVVEIIDIPGFGAYFNCQAVIHYAILCLTMFWGNEQLLHAA